MAAARAPLPDQEASGNVQDNAHDRHRPLSFPIACAIVDTDHSRSDFAVNGKVRLPRLRHVACSRIAPPPLLFESQP